MICPRCNQELGEGVTECQVCQQARSSQGPPPVVLPLPWYFESSMLWFAILSAGPLALPLIWWHPRMSWFLKLVITILTVVFTWLAVLAIIWMCGAIMDQWRQIRYML